jgi:hypothetical protein
MIARATPEQALCLHLIAQLALPFTLPSERGTALGLLSDHLPALGGKRFAAVRSSALGLLSAKTPLEWSFACHDATRALVPLHRAEAFALIAGLSVKRVS